jgi:hypothetical protein
MNRSTLALLLLAVAGGVQAQSMNCATVPKTMPLRASVLAPVASELVSPSEQLGIAGGVLARAYDESQSVDQVLLRMRIESCKNVAALMPAPSVVDPLDPAAYKPKTEFDNTPWRFNMTQNGKSMTADEFSAWMKSRGVRVARGGGAAAASAVLPPGTAPGATQPTAPVPDANTVPANSPPGTLPAPPPATPAPTTPPTTP